MSTINNNAKEIHCKIVYYGPEGSGKSSSLKFIKQHSMESKVDSFLIPLNPPIESLVVSVGSILGFKTFFHIYAVPNLSLEEKTYLLRGVDGIVFVANSQKSAVTHNQESLDELHQILQEQKKDIFKIPLVFQYHKRDILDSLPVAILRAQLNKYNCKDFESSIKTKKHLLEPLKYLFKSVLTVLKSGEII